MDDLLLFTLMKKSHIAKIRFIESVIKRYHTRNVNFLERNYNTWEILHLLRIGECVLNGYNVV